MIDEINHLIAAVGGVENCMRRVLCSLLHKTADAKAAASLTIYEIDC